MSGDHPVSERAYFWLHSLRATDEACKQRLIGLRENPAIVGERLAHEIREYDRRIEVYDYLHARVPA